MSWQKDSSSTKEVLNLEDNFPVLPLNTEGDLSFLKERTLSANESLAVAASPGRIDLPDAPCGTGPSVDLLSVLYRGRSRGFSLFLCRPWPSLLNINTAGFIGYVQRNIKHSVDKPIRVGALWGRAVCLLHPLSSSVSALSSSGHHASAPLTPSHLEDQIHKCY